MNNTIEACDSIRKYLNTWYGFNKNRVLSGKDLHDAKKEYIKQNPQYEKYSFDIDTGFILDSFDAKYDAKYDVHREHATHHGVYVKSIDWEQIKNLALKESKTLTLIKSLVK